ncbi:hypothetical protein L2E82_26983 [Cichorium intybus]|uniref:Uncharacterized protein n=1 Tax=Cichorium intybus TaxID=13427 RepID=A0ACB9CRY1_CICIN|nr:hypothetical protein L2E82_26983 [Cichorium intybus]
MYLQNIWLNESSLGVKQLILKEALSIEDVIRKDSAWHSIDETDSIDLAVENMILMRFKMHKKEFLKGNGFRKS